MRYTKQDKAKDSRLKRTYGISLDYYRMLLIEQGGGCWMCGRKPPNRLCVDHRHVKGYKKMSADEKRKETRGILCFLCNVTLGKLEKRTDARYILGKMVEYAAAFKLRGD